MASYNELLALIDAYINQNGVQAITGQVLNGVLRAMVDQLGRGYAIMGAADPTTDPGTPDGPETWFASVPGTYTNFDGIQIVPGELALLSYVPSTGFSKNTIYEGFQTVQATIDGNVGTPAVGVSYANGILSFDFHNMKGVTGDPAGFGAVTASVDGNIGTPSVQVQTSGPDTAKAIAFQFHNLKGETGVTSVLATVDNTSGNPQCAVSLNGQQLVLNFTGLKGAQGDTGSSVDYPFTIVNNLTTNDPAQALSAAMGVQLESEVSQLEAEVDELEVCNKPLMEDNYDAEELVRTTDATNLYFSKSNPTIVQDAPGKTGWKISRYEVRQGDVIKVTSEAYQDHNDLNVGFTTVIPANGVSVFGILELSTVEDVEAYCIAPADGYFCICSWYLNILNIVVYSLHSRIVKLEGDVANKQDINNTERVRFFQFSDFSGEGYINNSGELTQHATYISTDFIQANPGGIIKYKDLRTISGYPLIALYDKEKNFIGSEPGGSAALSGTYTIPANVFYVRFVCYDSLRAYNPALVITDEIPKEDGTSEIVSPVLEDYVRHENLCNENIFIADSYVSASTGLLADGTGYYKTSYLLKIRPSSKIFIFGIWSGNGVVSVAYYDADFAFLSSDSIKGVQDYERGAFFTVPSTAYYVRFVVRNKTGSFRGYVNTISAEIYSPSIKKQATKLHEKTVVFLGDSITAGANVVPVTEGVVKPYPYLVADATGLFPIVGAAPGGFFKYTEGSEYSIPSQVELITITPDIIVIEGGVNDYASGRVFGSVDYGSANMYSDTLDDQTFLGGLEKTLRLCATRFPGVPLLYVIATKARNYEWATNSQGQTYREYVDEILKVCKKYGVRVVNLHDGANLVPQMPQYYENTKFTYEGDNLHPTTLSYKTWYVNPVIQGLLAVCAEK